MKWGCSIIFICHLVFWGTFTEYPSLYSSVKNRELFLITEIGIGF